MEKKLNKEQLKAIGYKKGPLLIIAGAGTGKTTVITERIKYIVEKDLAKMDEILALTFTDKAAREMEERVDVALPYGYTQMWISTFHSFCDQVLCSDALHIGLDPRYKLMTQAQTIQLIRDNLFNFELKYFRPLGNPTKFVGGMLQHFSRLQDEDVAPDEYLKWVEKQKGSRKKVRASHNAKFLQDDSVGLKSLSTESNMTEEEKLELEKWTELSNAYKAYDELKVKEGLFDYGDLITKTLKLFRERPNILKKYKDKFKYILVDEFQDTNIAQNDLVMMIAGKNGNITVVADDDQSIYKWRGAAVSNVLQFRKNYPKTELITLTKNYRSGQKILDSSYKLIQHNNPDRLEQVENIDKKLISQVKIKGEINFIHKDRVENEADAVSKEIKQLIDEEEYEWSDIAILVRANNHADSLIRSFQRKGIPYQFLGPGRLFKQPEVIDMISYLKVLYNFEDDVALYRLLSIEELAIDLKDLARVANYSKKYNLSLYDAIKEVKDPPSRKATEGHSIFIKEKTRKKLKKIIKIIDKHLELIRKDTAGQLLYDFLEESELLVKLLNPDTAVAQKRAKNISKFFDKLRTYEVDNEDATVVSVVDWIDLSMDLGESPLAADIDWTEINAVNILTVHSAKGLEFPVVFMVNLVSERFPSRSRSEQIPIPEELVKEALPAGDYHLQEERRLFYVGMTRAKEILFFTAADYYGEGKREKKLSPFIFEALGDKAVYTENGPDDSEQLSILDYKPLQIDPSTVVSTPVTDFHIDYLSYSQIDVFRVCPLHYKLKYLLNVQTPTTSALSFGMTMHATMKDFYEVALSGKKVSEKTLLEIYDRDWRKEGYTSRAYEKKMHTRGLKYLKGFFDKSFDTRNLPRALELPFVVPLQQAQGKLSQRPLKIGGKMDRVDILPDGTVEIIDYKTGEKVPSQAQADKDLQLTFYALAASKLSGDIFNVDVKKLKMSFYYFEEQVKVTTQRTKSQLERAEKEIFEWREKIETSDFKCSKHVFCENCEYKLFCAADE